MKELISIQANLKAPKGQRNNFGKYNYRSCEDILEAVKPLLKAENSFLTLSDEIVNIGTRNYVKATATIYMPEDKTISVSASACEAEVKKGMDPAQITGAASSYARKYALNGLFTIDDTKDADTQPPPQQPQQPTYTQPQQNSIQLISKQQADEFVAIAKTKQSRAAVIELLKQYQVTKFEQLLAAYVDGVKKGLEGIK